MTSMVSILFATMQVDTIHTVQIRKGFITMRSHTHIQTQAKIKSRLVTIH